MRTVLVDAKNLTIEFPIYGTRSLKNRFMSSITGGLIKVAGSNSVVKALDNVSFQFYEGDRIGFWGHNGSGKTTLLRVIAGIYFPTIGSISVNGNVNPLLNISLGMEADATGLENIYVRAAMMGLTSKQIEEKLDDIIKYSELGDFIQLPMRTYSSGMQLRLAFSISTCVQSDILLMDEWLSVGDENFTKKASERLNTMKDKSQLFILASHNKQLLNTTCNRIIHMQRGKFVEENVQS